MHWVLGQGFFCKMYFAVGVDTRQTSHIITRDREFDFPRAAVWANTLRIIVNPQVDSFRLQGFQP